MVACSATSPYGSLMEHQDAESPVGVIAERVREVRGRLGLTAQQLADRLRDAGLQWDRGTVTKLETGRRQNVSVAELLALARALHAAPVHLLVPLDGRPYQVTPNEVLGADRVRSWICGDEPLPGTDRRIFRTEVPLDEAPAVHRARFGGRLGSAELEALYQKDQRAAEVIADDGQHREEAER